MTKPFPDSPYLQGNYAPLLMEPDAANLEVIREIPPEICGTLYRNGPNPQSPRLSDYRWFSGDGMIHAFHIEDGKAIGFRGPIGNKQMNLKTPYNRKVQTRGNEICQTQ